MQVPFMNLGVLHEPIRDEITAAINHVLDSCAFAGGVFVETFEDEFSMYCQCEHAIGVGSGTEAIWLALLGLGVGHGDEVITVPNTFIATAEAISFCGATPVFVDIDEQTYTMAPDLIEAAITPRTKAIVPVHLFGQMADMDPIMEIANSYGLYVVEDACQAHGAKYKDSSAGSIGDAGCFSFYPGKNLGAMGEAGAVVTNNSILAEKIKNLRDHGQTQKYLHQQIGWNARMDGVQAAVLSVKLKYLNDWNSIRRQHARRYNTRLSLKPGIKTPSDDHHRYHVYHVYSVRVENRTSFMSALNKNDISCGIHYPFPVHTQKAYEWLRQEEGSFPVAEKCAREFVSLPMCPTLSEDQIEYVSQRAGEVLCQDDRKAFEYAMSSYQPVTC